MMRGPERASASAKVEAGIVMAAQPVEIVVDDITVEVVRKNIRGLRLRVYPPHGRVRVAAPLVASAEAVRQAVVGKLDWIKRHRARFAAQSFQARCGMTDGELHPYLGQQYRLLVQERPGPAKVELCGLDTIELCVRPGTGTARRKELLDQWYRARLAELVPPLLEQWQPVVGVRAAHWGIKKMKTKWGSCNIRARRIWLNLELARCSPRCLEFVLVHELAHLLERLHNKRFYALMDSFLPHWRACREELHNVPLAYDSPDD